MRGLAIIAALLVGCVLAFRAIVTQAHPTDAEVRPGREAPAARRPAGSLALSRAPDDQVPAAGSSTAAHDPGTHPDRARLIAALSSDDHVVIAEAASGLVARGDVSAIAALTAIDVRRRPGASLAVIDALGRLGGIASGSDRTDAVARLLDLLRNEKLHPAPERAGDLVQIYEALGATRDPRAAAALERELLDPAVGKAPKVAAVEALAAIGAPSSVEALSALRDHLEVTLETDPYEQELRRDLLDAIGRATG